MGCGACATVCPSGAMTYQYPAMPDLGARVRTLLATYARAGGRDAPILVHAADAREPIARLARRGRGLPARVDSARGAPRRVDRPRPVAGRARLGRQRACRCWSPATRRRRTSRRSPSRCASATRSRRRWATRATHFRLVDLADVAGRGTRRCGMRRPRSACASAATFAATTDKRATMAFALDHLAAHAPVPRTVIPLPPGAPWGRIDVDRDACTLCLACVGACPEGALLDHAEAPALRFIESKCVQCGLCESTCPERAIALVPQLDLPRGGARAARAQRGGDRRLHACGKPLGTAQDDRRHAGAPRRSRDVREARRARPPADVRRLPRQGDGRRRAGLASTSSRADASDGARRAKPDRRCRRRTNDGADAPMTSAPVALQYPAGRRRIAPVPTCTRWSRASSSRRPTPTLLATLGDRAELLPEDGSRRCPPPTTACSSGEPRHGRRRRGAGVHGALHRRREDREVNLHASHWRTGFMMDKPLADLRGDLAALGLERRDESSLLEDHLASLAEIDADADRRAARGARRRPLDVQRRFFECHDRRLGVRMLRCNNHLFACQLLPAGRRIRPNIPGDRT